VLKQPLAGHLPKWQTLYFKRERRKNHTPEEQMPGCVGGSTQAAQAFALQENRAILW